MSFKVTAQAQLGDQQQPNVKASNTSPQPAGPPNRDGWIASPQTTTSETRKTTGAPQATGKQQVRPGLFPASALQVSVDPAHKNPLKALGQYQGAVAQFEAAKADVDRVQKGYDKALKANAPDVELWTIDLARAKTHFDDIKGKLQENIDQAWNKLVEANAAQQGGAGTPSSG